MSKQHAYKQLLKEHIGLIRKISRTYSNGKWDYEDNVQEVCLQLWRSFDQFRGESKQSTWIYRIAINTCINQLKKRTNKKITEAEEVFIDESARNPDSKTEQVNRIYEGIKQLDPAERAIILLYLEKRTTQEIASVVGITSSNAGVKINRIKKKLKRIINE